VTSDSFNPGAALRLTTSVARVTCFLLGWVLVATALPLPGAYSSAGGAWNPGPSTTPTWLMVLIHVVIAAAVDSPFMSTRKALVGFLTGWSVLLATGSLLLSPLFYAVRGRREGTFSRFMAVGRFVTALLLLLIWIRVALHFLHSTPRIVLKFGYYQLAVGYTLVSLALISLGWRRSARRPPPAFEVVPRED
jgi:hypothetical protein